MRKTCAKPVDGLRETCEHEHYLYPDDTQPTQPHVSNPRAFHGFHHTITPSLSTAFFHQINLLVTELYTVSTGLITNTTKYI